MRGSVRKGVAVVALLAVLPAGCATMEANPKTTIGAVGGGALGGLIAGAAGANPAAIAAATIGGVLVGNLLDERDKRLAAQAAQRAFESAPTGQPVAWQNPDSGHSGTVTVTKTSQATSGSYSRQYETAVNIGGKLETAHGTACRQPDGTWRIVS